MNKEQTFDTGKVKAWLSGEVRFRMARKWLVIGGAALAVLLVIAFD
jgi:hypothetical protein